jgi:hypothetical protein
MSPNDVLNIAQRVVSQLNGQLKDRLDDGAEWEIGGVNVNARNFIEVRQYQSGDVKSIRCYSAVGIVESHEMYRGLLLDNAGSTQPQDGAGHYWSILVLQGMELLLSESRQFLRESATDDEVEGLLYDMMLNACFFGWHPPHGIQKLV